jgi:hypothetical protein
VCDHSSRCTRRMRAEQSFVRRHNA